MTLVNSERYSELRKQGFSPEVAKVMASDGPSIREEVIEMRRQVRQLVWMVFVVVVASWIIVLKLFFG
jgi:hypothetical protein